MARHPIARLAPGLLAAALAAPAASLAGPNCFFQTVGRLTLDFGMLDPSVGTTVVAKMAVATPGSDQVGNCRRTTQTMTLTVDNGSNYAGGTRRLSSGRDFIAYTISGSGTGWTGTTSWTHNKPGNNTWVAIPTLFATIIGTDYQNVSAGSYSDTVVLTISP